MNIPEIRILIIDDDTRLQSLLNEYLVGRGYSIQSHYTGENFWEEIERYKPDCLILDIMLPKKDGLSVLKEIRIKSEIPILLLSARGDDTDRIIGLELGADDYLPKPFNPRELDARIKAILRRKKSEYTTPQNNSILEWNGIQLDRLARTISYLNNTVDCSNIEVEILSIFFSNPNRTINRDEIMNFTKGRDFMGFERSIDVHISKLRNKLDEIKAGKERIQTVWGKGYRLIPIQKDNDSIL
jgi:two-component system phosphate regulon response regulator OmpR